MDSLLQIQQSMRESIHAGRLNEALDAEIISDELTAAQRMQVYQNNYRLSLIDALSSVYVHVAAFTGEPFTRKALEHFIEQCPPKEPALHTYGSTFPEFLKEYEPAQGIPYLSDVAELGWAVHALQFQKIPDTLAAGSVNPCAMTIESDYPLLNLWMVANGQLPPEAVSLDQDGQVVCVVLHDFEVRIVALSNEELSVLKQVSENRAVSVENTRILDSLNKKAVLL